MRRRVGAVAALVAVMGIVLAGCGRSSDELPLVRADVPFPRSEPATPPAAPPEVAAQTVSRPGPQLWPVVERDLQVPGPPYKVAEVKVPKIGIYESPTAATPLITLSARTQHGFPRVLLTAAQHGDRWKVLLPVRPNGSVGWVRAAEVDIQDVNYWMRVDTASRSMTVGNGNQLVAKEPVAVGTGGTPTPRGNFYLMELVRPLGQPYYGPFAYTTSAFSDVLFSFMGGPGTVGIHGTNAPGSVGRAASNGCIRLNNSAITMLAKTLPLGTPVFVS